MKSRLYVPEKKLQNEFLPPDYFNPPSLSEANQKKPKIKKVNLSFLKNKLQKEKDNEISTTIQTGLPDLSTTTNKIETPDPNTTTIKTEATDSNTTTIKTEATDPNEKTIKIEKPVQSSMTENELLIDYFKRNEINSNPIEVSNESRQILINDIYPIINPINSNLKKDIDISIKLIKYLRSAKLLEESISFIAKEFCNRISDEKSMSIVYGFAYILSRVTDLCKIEGKNLKLIFFKEFQIRIPWLAFDKKFSDPTIKIDCMKCLIGLIFNWLSYDVQLVEFITIPIIENIIKNNNLDIFGCFIEEFLESSSLIAFNSCPDKISDIFCSLKKKLKDHGSDKVPSIVRLKNIVEMKKYPFPFTLQYTDIEAQNFDKIADTAAGDD